MRSKSPAHYRLLNWIPLAAALGMIASVGSLQAQPAAAPTYNPSMLAFPVDMSLFAQGTPVLPGTYRVDVVINDHWQGKRSITFQALTPGDPVAQPCFTEELIEHLGLDPDQLDPAARARLQAGESLCVPLAEIAPHTQARFDAGAQSLKITAPQIVLLRRARGYVDPSRWDAGVPAATLAYDYNAWQNRQAESSHTSHYLGLRGGINLGHWRLRLHGAATRSNEAGFSYRNSAFYIERALPAWNSTVQVGDTTSRSPVLDSLPLRGVRIETEDSMRPDSLRGFAPVIRGVAQSNAKVSITQLGVQIFETTVPPGPFVIDDLYPNGSSGDLLVTITEADGAEHRFTVTNNSLPELLRPGTSHYSVSVGRYRNRNFVQAPLVGVASASYGVNNTVTAYGGALAAGGYRAVSAGLGLNLPLGAITLDATHARTGHMARGLGLRLGYARHLHASATDITLAMLRHATSGYHDAAQGLQILEDIRRGHAYAPQQRTRNQLSLHLNQALPGAWGAISFSGSVQDYWLRAGRDAQYSIAYGRGWGSVNVNLNLMRSRNVLDGRWDNQAMLSFSLPLGGGSNPVSMNTSFNHTPSSQSVQSGVSGSLGERHQHHYSVYAAADRARGQATQTRGGASFHTRTRVAQLGASVAQGAYRSRQLGFSASGGVVAFADGVVLTPELGETIGIVQAPGAAGTRLANYGGATLNRRGYAVASWLSPYRENDVQLDTKGAGLDVELLATNQKVAPTRGAVVLLRFETREGDAVLLTLRQPDGSATPFAAGIFDAQGNNVGYVAQGGQALVRVKANQGELSVRWGSKPDQQCRFAYDLQAPAAASGAPIGGFRRVEAVCL